MFTSTSVFLKEIFYIKTSSTAVTGFTLILRFILLRQAADERNIYKKFMAIRIGATGGNNIESRLPLTDQNVENENLDNGIHGCADENPTDMFASDHRSSGPAVKPQESICFNFNVSRSISKTAPSLSNSHETKATKKSDHNAKEKLRRTKLNDAYSSLKSLLPDAYISKKKWSYPMVVSKVLEYIPELQEEIEKLKEKKDSISLSSQEKQTFITDKNPIVSSAGLYSGPIVSTMEINKGEITAQICVRWQLDVFPLLLENLEREGNRIANASTVSISTERVCYNLHPFMKTNSDQPTHYVDNLRNKIVSWLLPSTL